MENRLKGSLLILAASVVWGLTPVIEKVALNFVEPMAIASWRFLIAGALLAPVLGARKKLDPLQNHEKVVLGLAAIVGVSMASIMWYTGMQLTDAVSASITERMEPLWVGVLGAVLLGERVKKDQVIGTLLITSGVILLFMESGFKASLGLVFILFASFGWALQIVLTKNIIRKVDTLHLFVYQSLLGGSVNLAIAYLFLSDASFMLTADGWLYVAVLAVLASVAAGMLFFHGLRFIEAERASAISSTMPLFTMLFSALLLSQTATLAQAGGALLMMAGVTVLSATQKFGWTIRHSFSMVKQAGDGPMEKVRYALSRMRQR